MNGINEACAACGHDISSHFMDAIRPTDVSPLDVGTPFRGACLGMMCSCMAYREKTKADREGVKR